MIRCRGYWALTPVLLPTPFLPFGAATAPHPLVWKPRQGKVGIKVAGRAVGRIKAVRHTGDASSPLDQTGIAAALGIVDVEIGYVRPFQHRFEQVGRNLTVNEVRSTHHAAAIEGAHRQRPNTHDVGYLIDPTIGDICTFADEDGVAGSIGRIGRLMRIVHEQERFAGFGIAHLDTIREPGFAVGDITLGAHRLEFIV